MSKAHYATDGKPLSQTALYQQKLRSGIYNTPSSNIGVNSNASDTAALLAASADLTVRPSYERTIAPEAQDAAVAARLHQTTAWSRDSTDPQADAAANSSLRSNGSFTSQSTEPNTGIYSFNSGNIYRAANKQSTSTMTSRITPERNIQRSGLETKSATAAFDINKINAAATKNSSKSLNTRFNPELDRRSGLSSQKPTEFLNQEEENLAAASATASLKEGNKFDYANQKRSNTFTASSVVNANLLAAANKSASDKIKSISSGTPADFKAQAQLYAKALAIAQKNSNDRINNHTAGVIDLGGGLTMTQAELDKLASVVVNPVLSDIEAKATAQRDIDLQKQQKHAELVEEHAKAKRKEEYEKLKDKEAKESAKQKRVTENEDKKKTEDEKFLEYQNQKQEEFVAKELELKEVEDIHAQSKTELLEEKQANQDKIDTEEEDLINERKEELKTLQDEKDELLKPTLEELTVESGKLKEVTNARDELKTEVETAEKTNKEYLERIAQLEKELAETEESIEQFTSDLATAKEENEITSKEVDDLQQKSIDELKKAEEANKELDTNIAVLGATRTDHIAKKTNQKDEIKQAIDNRVKEEHKINEELPEHLRYDVDEKKLRDTSSIFSDEEPEVVKEEPKPEVKKTEAEVVTPVKKSTNPPAKKKSGLRRLSSLFKSKDPKPQPKPLAVVDPKKSRGLVAADELLGPLESEKSSIKPKETKEPVVSRVASETPATETKETKSESVNSVYDDDISISKDKNQGGLFKEEI